MGYIYPDDSISQLRLSNRTINCLVRMQILTVGDLMNYRGGFSGQQKVGPKTMSEIDEVRKHLRNSRHYRPAYTREAVEQGGQDEKTESGDLSIVTYAKNYRNPVYGKILCDRLNGMTLEEIGQEQKVTREAIRQKIMTVLKSRPPVREDVYLPVFTRYMFSREDFLIAFPGEPESTYYYLRMVDPGKAADHLPLEEVLSDESISPEIRKACERAVYKNDLLIDGVRVRKTTRDLVEYLIRRCCTDSMAYHDFLQIYRDTLAQHGLDKDPAMQINDRTYENYLNGDDTCLWTQGRHLRYYNIKAGDFTSLVEEIDLNRYMNQEISTLLLFRAHPETMEAYDIRDEYELHNLLRKIWDRYGNAPAAFHRSPTVRIGKTDRNQQVTDLLFASAPISMYDLGSLYEEKYGAKRSTVMGTYVNCIGMYLHDGSYRVDYESLTPEEMREMKKVLTAPFYTFSEIRKIYLDHFPSGDVRRINAYSIRALGLKVNGAYAFDASYSSASSYFESILLQDEVDLRQLHPQMIRTQCFGAVLSQLKKERKIIEYQPHCYRSMAGLIRDGITPTALDGYIRAVEEFTEDGRPFTVCSLRKEGFSHPLDRGTFDDWFFSSVLVEERKTFSYLRLGGNKLFVRGTKKPDPTQLVLSCLGKARFRKMKEIVSDLRSRYGLELDRERVRAYIEDSGICYDSVEDMVYASYADYAEAADAAEA